MEMPHERTDKNRYERLRVILEPTGNVEEISRLHTEDEDTTWFGIEKDTTGQPIFQDYGLAILCSWRKLNSRMEASDILNWFLFVGQTGQYVYFSVADCMLINRGRRRRKYLDKDVGLF